MWSALATLCHFTSMYTAEKALPDNISKIMHQDRYKYSAWGLYVKDLQTGNVLYDLRSQELFSPASTTKLFSVAALLNAYGTDYRFKTPVYAVGKVHNNQLDGDLVIVAQGDFIFGGRFAGPNKVSFTKLDHINANEVPGVILTKEDPLHALNDLAKQIFEKGIKQINGDVLIDESLFETTLRRGYKLSPIFLNENFIDIVLNPERVGQPANLTWRPIIPGYKVVNETQTVEKGGKLAIEITPDEQGHTITVKGTIPADQHDLVRTFSVQDPAHFVRAAFIQALKNQGINVNLPSQDKPGKIRYYGDLKPVAEWTSAPISEYAKLILKVSHNLGADLIPLLLAIKKDKKTFDDGMLILGDFIRQDVKLPIGTFVLEDAGGGNGNRLSPHSEVTLLDFMQKQRPKLYPAYLDALPTLGVDGSLEDFAKKSSGVGKVHAKPGTGMSINLAIDQYFLITQALGGYIEGKNGHIWAYMLVINNSQLSSLEEVFTVFEDVSQISSHIYDMTE